MGNKIQRFEDFEVWKRSMNLVSQIYNSFQHCKDFGFKDQIQRASVSVPTNFAEGYERATNKEFVRFLNIANASNAELRTLLYLAIKLGYLSQNDGNNLIDETKEISAMIIKLRTYRKNLLK